MRSKPSMIAIVGLPLLLGNRLYNVAAVLSNEGVLGIVPKTYIPNNNEYYEKRWFAGSGDLTVSSTEICNRRVPVLSGGAIFRTPFALFGERSARISGCLFPLFKTIHAGVRGHLQPLASNELVGKNAYRKSLILQQSGVAMRHTSICILRVRRIFHRPGLFRCTIIAENARLLARGDVSHRRMRWSSPISTYRSSGVTD